MHNVYTGNIYLFSALCKLDPYRPTVPTPIIPPRFKRNTTGDVAGTWTPLSDVVFFNWTLSSIELALTQYFPHLSPPPHRSPLRVSVVLVVFCWVPPSPPPPRPQVPESPLATQLARLNAAGGGAGGRHKDTDCVIS